MADVFISYKREERDKVELIAGSLRELDLDVWFDASLDPGSSFDEEINREVRNAHCVLVMWSPGAIASDWVRAEASIGKARDVLVSAFLEPCDLYPPFNLIHTERLDSFSGDPRHAGWRKVVEAVGRKIGRPGLGAYVAAHGAADREWRWANEWPADPLADRIWARRIENAGEREGAHLAEERARLLRDGAARKAPPQRGASDYALNEDEVPVERAPRRHGFARWVALTTFLLGVLWIGWLTFFGVPSGFTTLLSSPGLSSASVSVGAELAQALVAAPIIALLLAWSSRWILPRGAVPLSIGRGLATLAFVSLGVLVIWFVPAAWVVASSPSQWPTLGSILDSPSDGGFTRDVYSAVIFSLFVAPILPQIAKIFLATGLVAAVAASPLHHVVTLQPPSIRGRVFATACGALAILAGGWLWSNMDGHFRKAWPLPQTIAVELARVGYSAPVRRDSEIEPSFAPSNLEDLEAEREFSMALADAIRVFEADLGLPITGEATRALLARLRAMPSKRRWRVGPSEDADTTTISEALARAAPGATVDVESGLYREHLQVPNSVRLSGYGHVTLESVSNEEPIIRLDDRAELSGYQFVIRRRHDVIAISLQDGAKITGVTVSDAPGGGARRQAAVSYYSNAHTPVEIRDVTVQDVRGLAMDVHGGIVERVTISRAANGIQVTGGDARITESTLTNISGSALIATGSGEELPVIENNSVNGAQIGFQAYEQSAAQFRNNRVSNISEACAYLSGESNAVVADNRFSNCGSAGYYPLSASATARGTIENNVVLASRAPIVWLEPGSTAVARNNRDRD